MKIFFFIIFASITLVLNAQKGAVTSAGDNNTKNGRVVNWTIGSIVSGSSHTNTKLVSTGDIHPVYHFFYEQEGNQVQLDCFPNPATEYINVELHTNEFDGMVWVLYSVNGETIMSGELESNTFKIPIHNLSAANYLLNIYDTNKQIISGAKLLKK